ncbi:MAG: polysaccharide deacetylase [Deltaproteobacteria bacterium RBG_16_49_23]|nr:MAG: polysaccharide deacetylase [Deltaproteobacteria bacterium RBG_16_49_23]
MKRYKANLTLFSFCLLTLCLPVDASQCQVKIDREKIVSSMSGRIPKEWGERVSGVKTRLAADRKIIALTFDACGGRRSSSYDAKLIGYLEEEKIPATLFISGGWIDVNLEIFKKLARNPLFDIGNHGLNHKPCSSMGRSAYGIEGTKNVDEMFDEIEQNAIKIETLTGRRPKYYRPATGHSDEICVEMANALGYEVVNFSLSGDAGATFKKSQVKEALLNVPPSSIILLHMNRPEGGTAEGVMEAIPEFKKRGIGFVKLSDTSLR